ncbi:hypothetical protein F4806DRAFT_479152 [Annulohypoxylon nitens]|nr:hypothetical protein F4806DRAFT_479152 [Annulohypoxylon nitens]
MISYNSLIRGSTIICSSTIGTDRISIVPHTIKANRISMASNATSRHGSNQKALQVTGDKFPIQTQLIDSRHVRDPTHLVLLLNDEYGNGNYEVEMRHNYFTIRAPGRLQWNQVCKIS